MNVLDDGGQVVDLFFRSNVSIGMNREIQILFALNLKANVQAFLFLVLSLSSDELLDVMGGVLSSDTDL